MAAGSIAKPKLGIISGAGPMAGLSLCKQTITLMQKHGAWQDQDYPQITLLSYPFSDMLNQKVDKEIIKQELLSCLNQLEPQCDHVIIACNTLHLFLPCRNLPKLINLVRLVKNEIPADTKPLILASETSARHNLHGRLLGVDCEYWDPPKSQAIIDNLLKGHLIDLGWIYKLSQDRPVILGCSEYSLAFENIVEIKNIIDPIKLAAKALCKLGLNH